MKTDFAVRAADVIGETWNLGQLEEDIALALRDEHIRALEWAKASLDNDEPYDELRYEKGCRDIDARLAELKASKS